MVNKMRDERKAEIRRTLKFASGRMSQAQNPHRKFKTTTITKGEVVQMANELLDELDRLEAERVDDH